MSVEIMSMACEAKTGDPVTKLILIKLADNASDDGSFCPPLSIISRQAEVSLDTVNQHMDILKSLGIISKGELFTVDGKYCQEYIINKDTLSSLSVEDCNVY